MEMNTATKLFTSLDMQMGTIFTNEVRPMILELEFERMANRCMSRGSVEVKGTFISILAAAKDADVNWAYYAIQSLDPMMAKESKRNLEDILRPHIIEYIRKIYGSK
jgi:hypothetical protein